MGLYMSARKPLAVLLSIAILFMSLAVASADVQAAAGGFVREPTKTSDNAKATPWYEHVWNAVKWVGAAYVTVVAGSKLINSIKSGDLYRNFMTALGLGPQIEPLAKRNMDLTQLTHIYADLVTSGRLSPNATIQDMLNDVFVLADGSVRTRAELERMGIVPDGKGGYTLAMPTMVATQTQQQQQQKEPERQLQQALPDGWYKRHEFVLKGYSKIMPTGQREFDYYYELYENLYYAGQLRERTLINRIGAYKVDFPWESLDERDYGCNVKVYMELPYFASNGDPEPLGWWTGYVEFEYIGDVKTRLASGDTTYLCNPVSGNAPGQSSSTSTTSQQNRQQQQQQSQQLNTATSASEYIEYVVQPGDQLLKIAIKFGVDADLIRDLNNIVDPNKIYIGQVLRIPKKNN